MLSGSNRGGSSTLVACDLTIGRFSSLLLLAFFSFGDSELLSDVDDEVFVFNFIGFSGSGGDIVVCAIAARYCCSVLLLCASFVIYLPGWRLRSSV